MAQEQQYSEEFLAELKTVDQEAAKEAEELARQLATQEHIYSYPDGSVYMGHMRHDGKRHGRGTDCFQLIRKESCSLGHLLLFRLDNPLGSRNH